MAQGFITQQADRSVPGATDEGVPNSAILGGIWTSPAGGAGAFTVNELGAFVERSGGGGGGTFQMAIYDLDGSGDLDNLIGHSGVDSEKNPPNNEAWVEWTGLSITIDGSTAYAICVWPDDGQLKMMDHDVPGDATAEYNSSPGTPWTWPDLAGVSTGRERTYAIYAVYGSAGENYLRYIGEIVGLKDTALRKSVLKRSINESIDIVESIATRVSTLIKKFINESVDLIEATYRKSTLKRFISSTVDIIESVKPVRALKRIISETLDLAESTKAVRSMKRILSSTVQIAENLVRKMVMVRSVSDTVDLIESVATAISAALIKIISETIDIIESINTHISTTLLKIINETADIVESVSTSISAALKKYINEIINLTEALTRKGSLKRILSESVIIIENIVYPRTLKRFISDTIELIESLRPVRAIVRKLTSTLSIIESLVRLKTMKRIISESISIIESIGITIGAALAIIYKDFRNVFTFDNLRRIFRIDR